MVADRKDWCISRQRLWGVPIPIFYCESCGKPVINEAAIKSVAKVFSEKGSDAWYQLEALQLLPEGFKCECGGSTFTKEKDTMDVWFDSGSSHWSVLSSREELSFPADMYLEGNDQYRGWFQSSLLTCVAKNGTAPYKSVLTHGFVIDEEKRKMSKSLGNGLPPIEVVSEYGADILRLWAASADYKADVRISKDILKQLSEGYRKIRNTARYILGSLYDFNPDTDIVSELEEIDKWVLMRLNQVIERVKKAYDNYEYHIVYHTLHNFCVVELSNFYLDVTKDRTYCEKPDSAGRRAAQTVMYLILDSLVKMIAPILSFTAEEIWQFMPHRSSDNTDSILFSRLPEVNREYFSEQLQQKWDRILQIRDVVAKELEKARSEKLIGSSLSAKVTIFANGEDYEFVKSILPELPMILIVSGVSLEKSEQDLSAEVMPADGQKCARCWIYSGSVGSSTPDLCDRCADVLK
jgi:isoleucyl-tRNA synthetase